MRLYRANFSVRLTDVLRNRKTSIMLNRYKVVMWDVLSGDFDRTITKERCLKNVLENTQPGSIIVFTIV